MKEIKGRGTLVFKDGHEETIVELHESREMGFTDFKTENGVWYRWREAAYLKREVHNDPDEGLISVYLDATDIIQHAIVIHIEEDNV